MVLAPENTREVTCPGCGSRRILSGRHARRDEGYGRPELCKLCRIPKPKPPTDSDRRYWLKRFSDEEIVALAAAFWSEEGDINYCHSLRITLCGKDELITA